MMFIRDGRAQWHQIVLSARDQPEKRILMQMAAQFVESRGCDAIVEVAEVWTAKLSPESLRYVGNLENLSGREEALAYGSHSGRPSSRVFDPNPEGSIRRN